MVRFPISPPEVEKDVEVRDEVGGHYTRTVYWHGHGEAVSPRASSARSGDTARGWSIGTGHEDAVSPCERLCEVSPSRGWARWLRCREDDTGMDDTEKEQQCFAANNHS